MISAPKHLWYGWVRDKSFNGKKEGKDVPKITQQGSGAAKDGSSCQPWAQHPAELHMSPLISGTFRRETKCNTEIKHMRLVSHLFITSLCTKCLLQCQGLLFPSIHTIYPLLSPLTPELHDPAIKKWF